MSVIAATPAHELVILDSTGDTKIIWDSENDDEIEVAKDTFKKLTKKGYLAFKVKKGGEKGEVVKEFDADAERLILTPPIAGG